MQTEIKSIETKYAGKTFRSRLEARWAMFFDKVGIDWVYEHEGYETPYGRYVPDFWLPHIYMRTKEVRGVYFEVKSSNYIEIFHPSLEYVCRQLGVGGILAKEFPKDGDHLQDCLWEIAPDWDNAMEIRKCNYGHMILDYCQYTFDDCVVCHEKVHSMDMIDNAIQSTLNYRFW